MTDSKIAISKNVFGIAHCENPRGNEICISIIETYLKK